MRGAVVVKKVLTARLGLLGDLRSSRAEGEGFRASVIRCVGQARSVHWNGSGIESLYSSLGPRRSSEPRQSRGSRGRALQRNAMMLCNDIYLDPAPQTTMLEVERTLPCRGRTLNLPLK